MYLHGGDVTRVFGDMTWDRLDGISKNSPNPHTRVDGLMVRLGPDLISSQKKKWRGGLLFREGEEDAEEMISHCASVTLSREERGNNNKKSSNRIARLNNTTE